MRTVGVEEELLLVDAKTGRPRAVAERVLRQVAEAAEAQPSGPSDAPTGGLEHEFQQQQIETDTAPHADMADLAVDLRGWRDTAMVGARNADARAIASGTSPIPVSPQLVRESRFEKMAETFGLTASEQLTCACHVHVSVESDDEGVGVLDRIRPWLHPLVALSANSPFWQGQDTGYASFRSQVMVRWPTAGPNDIFGSAEEYHRIVTDMLGTGVIMDEGMLYFDARLSHHFPTVEIRVADVCATAHDAVLIAAMCRGLVETAARDWARGEPAPPVPTPLLRLANWHAGRNGVEAELLDPRTFQPQPARDVIATVLEHIGPALRDSGDEALVTDAVEQVLTRGNGATRQRAILDKTGQLVDVVTDLAQLTADQEG